MFWFGFVLWVLMMLICVTYSVAWFGGLLVVVDLVVVGFRCGFI